LKDARFPIVEVEWVDAEIDPSSSGNLSNPDEVKKFGDLALCRDVGYLVRMDKKVVVLAVGISPEDGGFRHSNTVPRSLVLKITRLRVKR
jgi:hypothetical protein